MKWNHSFNKSKAGFLLFICSWGEKESNYFFFPVKNKDTKRHPAVLEEVIAAE